MDISYNVICLLTFHVIVHVQVIARDGMIPLSQVVSY